MKVGIDLINIENFKKSLKSPEFLEKVFHLNELKNKDKLSSIFALKEAAMKAIGKKLDWKDFRVAYDKQGKPSIEGLNSRNKFSCSLSHDGDYLLALVILESS